MTAKKSTGLATYLAVTGSIKDALDGSFIWAYSGTEPANADVALSGNTLLTKISVGGDDVTGLTFDGTPDAGVLKKTAAEAWKGTNQDDGIATFYRMAENEPNDASTTELRLQGNIGTSVLNDLVLTSAMLVSGNEQTIDQFQIS